MLNKNRDGSPENILLAIGHTHNRKLYVFGQTPQFIYA